MPTPTEILLEAEDLILDEGPTPYIISQTPVASGGALVFLPRTGDQGILRTDFTGESASYTLEIFYFDETDGESTFELKINGTSIESFIADSLDGAPGATGSRTSITFEDLEIVQGDRIEIFAAQDGGEPARIDNLAFTPTEEIAVATNNIISGTDDSERLEGTDQNDTITGRDGDDTIIGRGGDNTLYGGDGNDHLYGCFGEDTLTGDDGRDRLFGGDSNDTLNGGDGRDKLFGGAGDDLLIGGEGNDTLYGGGGSDIFSFTGNLDGDDRIKDFALNGPQADKLDISDLLTNFENGIDDINDFVEIIYRNNDRVDLRINEDGQGNDFARVAVISGSDFGGSNGVSVEDLLNSGQLII